MSEADVTSIPKIFCCQSNFFRRLELVGDQQRHNPLAYKIYIISLNTELAMHFG